MTALTKEGLEHIKLMATDAARIYGTEWDSALVEAADKSERYHAITSDHIDDVVVRTADNSNQSSWLCDYLEAASPGVIISIIDRLIAAEARLHDVAAHCANVEAQLTELQKQEPVFFINVDGDDWIQAGRIPGSAFDFTDLPDGVNKLYAAPVLPSQPQAVPDEKTRQDYKISPSGLINVFDHGHLEGWNACSGAMLQLSGNSEQVPPAVPRVIHDAMHNGTGFMEVGTDGIRHVDRADVLIPPEANSPVIPDGWRDGIEAAARWVDQQREDFDSEHGHNDRDTGMLEFSNDAQQEYSDTLVDIAEGIRSLIPQADAVKGQA